MYLIPLAWLYVALMMAVAEATSTQGSILGAVITFVLYGLLPVGILVYLMGTSMRRKERKRREALELQMLHDPASAEPDAGSHTPGTADIAIPGSGIAPVRKEP